MPLNMCLVWSTPFQVRTDGSCCIGNMIGFKVWVQIIDGVGVEVWGPEVGESEGWGQGWHKNPPVTKHERTFLNRPVSLVFDMYESILLIFKVTSLITSYSSMSRGKTSQAYNSIGAEPMPGQAGGPVSVSEGPQN